MDGRREEWRAGSREGGMEGGRRVPVMLGWRDGGKDDRISMGGWTDGAMEMDIWKQGRTHGWRDGETERRKEG